MKFEIQVQEMLRTVLDSQGSKAVVDSLRTLEEGSVVIVAYHLEGKWASPAGFTFAFEQWVPLQESLAAFVDFNERSWANARFAPSLEKVMESGYGKG